MKIQYIGLYNNIFKEEKEDEDFKIRYISGPNSLDEFDVNIISFDSSDFWKSKNNEIEQKIQKDIEHIYQMVEKSNKSKIIIIFPMDYVFLIYNSFERRYNKSENLKNIIVDVYRFINYNLPDFININYENTKSLIGDYEIPASFYFDLDSNQIKTIDVLKKSMKSEKTTVIRYKKIIYTTLTFKKKEEIKRFLEVISLSEEDKIPNWLTQYDFLDDLELKNRKKDLVKEMERIQKKIDDNNRYKSILVSNGDYLVKVVTEIFEEILGIKLNDFKDEKKEDMRIELDEVIFLLEIKGVNTGIQNKYISQLDTHVQIYNDEGNSKKGKGILVINYNREKIISERDEISQNALNLALRNKSLIISTEVLLKIFEKFREKKIKIEDIRKTLIKENGILKIEIFETAK